MKKEFVALTLRLPKDTHDRFLTGVYKERRSMTQQIVWLIERWLNEAK